MDPDTIDIIDGLLSLKINDRYGCGPEGSQNDIENLK